MLLRGEILNLNGSIVSIGRMQDLAPVKRANEMEAQGKKPDEQTRRWAILWRSIILSTMEGKTIFPYCRYIRVLDLQDFTGLLEELNGSFAKHQKYSFYYFPDLASMLTSNFECLKNFVYRRPEEISGIDNYLKFTAKIL